MIAININNPDVSIGAEHIASRNLAIWGGSGRLPVYDKFAASILNNEIVISSGIFSNQGYEIEIPEGETETFSITTESAGIKRYDLIVSELARDSDGTETHAVKIVSGTAAISPTMPELTTGDFKGGEDLRQEMIHCILVDGTSASVVSSAPVLTINGGSSASVDIYVQPTAPTNPNTGDLWFW